MMHNDYMFFGKLARRKTCNHANRMPPIRDRAIRVVVQARFRRPWRGSAVVLVGLNYTVLLRAMKGRLAGVKKTQNTLKS